MASTIVIKAAGLSTSGNDLELPDGSLSEASNIIIKRDGIMEPRRGYNLYGSQLPLINERVKQLATYRDRILRHYSTKLAFDSDGAGVFSDFSGNFLEAQAGLRMKFIESNGNFYFTTADGIKKISAKTANDFSTTDNFIQSAGAIKAVDLQGELIYTPNAQSSFLPQDGAVAYRVVWGYNDANSNLVLGAPSQREIVGNPMLGLLLRDYMRCLDVLDNFDNTPLTAARINDKNYVSTLKLTLNSSANDLWSNLLALSLKIDTDIFIADQAVAAPLQISSATLVNGTGTVNFGSGTATDYMVAGSKIFLNGFNLGTQQEIQNIAFSTTPTSGAFTLIYNTVTSASIPFNAAAATIETTLRGVTGLGGIVVTGSINAVGGLTLTFPTTEGNVNQITAGTNTLNSGVPVNITATTTQMGVSAASGSFNGAQIVSSISASQITFVTDAVGSLSTGSPTIYSNEFRSILQPGEPSSPAANQELVDLQSYFLEILTKLGAQPAAIISVADQTSVDTLDITTTATVELTITIPEGIDSKYFYQVYRSAVSQATGAASFDDAVPNDELQLVYEAYPTAAELEAGVIVIEDITPDSFRGANLYTNASTGEGILAANDIPPFAKDINRYRNAVFYANTRTKHRASLNLLGVTQMIADFDLGTTPKVTITNGTTTNTYSFVTGLQEITQVVTVADVADSLNGKYFLLNGINDAFYVWFETTVAVDPAIAGRTGIKVNIDTDDSATKVASRTKDKLSIYLDDFIASTSSSVSQVITGTNAAPGVFTLASHGFKADEPIVFTTTGAFSGLVSGNTYYVRSPAANTFQLSLTAGGASISTVGAQSGVHSVTSVKVIEIANVDTGFTDDAGAGNSGFAVSTTQQGRGERIQAQITTIAAVAGNLYVLAGVSDYFTINTTLDNSQYYVWFQRGASTDPAVAGRIGLEIPITGVETAPQVAALIAAILPTAAFETEVNSNIITVTNIQYGDTTNATEVVANAGFTVTITQDGALDVLLSPLVSPARAVEETALSFIRSINKNPGEDVYGYYLSSAFDVPGQMSIEARNLEQTEPFYILGNNDATGLSFNPDIGPEGFISAISAADPTVITATAAHGLASGDEVVISSTNSIQNIDGLYTVTVLSPTTFSIDVGVLTGGTTGSFIKATNAVISENEEKSNRVYYSKFQQPEAVPIVNYFDVGAQDKAILRILPLRDSLFVFKEDGLYRISGDSAPFQLNLFDNSFICLAPDSVSVANNVIYAWTTQGIQSLTEGGAYVISRQIDNIILRTQSANFLNFKTLTWATGYESDNSYIVFTVAEEEDETAQIGYRYSTITQTWTTFDMGPNCGIINAADDKMYLGASDVAYIEQERKTFSRLDYTDREFSTVISGGSLLGNTIILPSVVDFAEGDVFVQDQTITAFEFNVLLDKLDLDSGVADSDYNTLYMVAGDNPRTVLNELAAKLDADTGVDYTQFVENTESKNGVVTAVPVGAIATITSAAHGLLTGRVVQFDSTNSEPLLTGPYTVTVINANTFTVPVRITVAGTTGNWQTLDSNFNDIKTCYNFIVATLNLDIGVSFNNYKLNNNNTIQESIITNINRITKQITLNLTLEYLAGAATVYKAITSSFTYAPNTMGDPLMLKHLREAHLFLEVTNITSATLSFSTDLLPEFISVPFTMSGNGIFGHSPFGAGFFGGVGNAAPFRTYIPRQCQRCRYIVTRFQHSIARETYAITGMALTGNVGQSTRTYR